MFQDERRRAADYFLRTPEGQREKQRLAKLRVDEEVDVIRQEVEIQRRDLEKVLSDLDRQLESRREALADLEGAEERRREEMEQQLREMREELESLQEVRDDRRSKVLAELLVGARPPDPVETGPNRSSRDGEGQAEPIQARRVPVRKARDLSSLADELSGRLSTWSPHEVANLLSCVISSPWTLVAGAPGAGKSTFVRSFVTQLGHGPGTGRYQELVVRRDWQDDSPLFGFWHPQKGAWEASSEGFVEMLLAAGDDHEKGLGGLYCAVLEELNLAAPEYYLSRPISVLESGDPTIRLYGDELMPANVERYPASFAMTPNVRLLATVNVDDTVERLSPRFLSRVQVLWMEPSLDAFRKPLELQDPPETPVDWSSIMELSRERKPPSTESLMRIVEYLHEQHVPGAPSPRTMRGMERYLAVARDLMAPKVAEDHQVLQRILPCIRGVGDRYRKVLDDLMAMCNRQGWRLSAARCERIRSRGEELGDFYDFFHC